MLFSLHEKNWKEMKKTFLNVFFTGKIKNPMWNKKHVKRSTFCHSRHPGYSPPNTEEPKKNSGHCSLHGLREFSWPCYTSHYHQRKQSDSSQSIGAYKAINIPRHPPHHHSNPIPNYQLFELWNSNLSSASLRFCTTIAGAPRTKTTRTRRATWWSSLSPARSRPTLLSVCCKLFVEHNK